MEVILRQAIENLGQSRGHRHGQERLRAQLPAAARLRLRGDARQPEAHRARARPPRGGRERAPRQRRRRSPTKLEEVPLTFSARVGEEGKLFGSVTSADIAEQLAAQGFHDREAPDRPARADQGARRLPRARQAARRREARDQGVGHQAVAGVGGWVLGVGRERGGRRPGPVSGVRCWHPVFRVRCPPPSSPPLGSPARPKITAHAANFRIQVV